MLRSKDGHGTWVSGRVLDSIQPIPDEVEGGSIIRNKDGEAVGMSRRFTPKVYIPT